MTSEQKSVQAVSHLRAASGGQAAGGAQGAPVAPVAPVAPQGGVGIHRLVFEANHMFVDLPEGRFLVDTGSPLSFGTTGTATYGGVTTQIPRTMLGIGMEVFDGLPGVRCDGLLGMDILGPRTVLWDGPRGVAIVGDDAVDPSAVRVPMRSLLGVPVVEGRIGGRDAACIFDTGAQYGYVLDESLVDGGEEDGELSDYNPVTGPIHSKAWRMSVDLGGVRFPERMGHLDGSAAAMLGTFGVEAIIGCSWLASRRVWFAPGQSLLAVA